LATNPRIRVSSGWRQQRWLIHSSDIGANASAEEAEEALEDQAVKVNNIVNSFRLQETSFDKKGYLAYLKGKTHRPFTGSRR
jgi:uncharacterized protein CbrC (UPF0167 family)